MSGTSQTSGTEGPGRDDYDSPWKQILEIYFEAFLAFFFPEAHAGIDWTRGYLLLDQELQQVVREAELGRRTVDKLVQVWLLGGEEVWVLVHVEIQSQRDSDFAERMYVYNYRLFDRYRRKIASLAVLADEEPSWRPCAFDYALWGCQVSLRFPAVKLLDYAERWAELEESDNPFADVVMAHLKTQATRGDPEERARWKLTLSRSLFRRGWSRDDILALYRFIDWLMALPEELQRQHLTTLRQEQEQEEPAMQYLTFWEKKGLEQGLREGKQEGLKEGLTKGVIQALQARFGTVPEPVVAAVGALGDLDLLGDLLRQAVLAESLESFAGLLRERAAK
jgi:hypothetical protein